MRMDEVRGFVAYNRWANARLLEVAGSLAEESLRAEAVSSFPSILETLGHIVGAEWIWLRRFEGEHPTAIPEWLDEPSLDSLTARLAEIEVALDALLASLADPDLDRELDYRTLDGTPHHARLADLLLHVVNHSSYHRGQLVTLLRQAGATPVATDYVLFQRQRSGS